MRESVSQSEMYANLASKVIKENKNLNWLSELTIGYVVSDKVKKSRRKIVYADCNKVPPLFKPFCPFDVIVRIYEPNAEELNDKQRYILMYHELLHIGLNGEEIYIVPHDVEDFREIIDKYGIDWSELCGENY